MPESGSVKETLTSDNRVAVVTISAPEEDGGAKKQEVQFHPDYKAMLDRFTTLLNSYHGGELITDGQYLHNHPRESDDDFEFRRKRSKYYNYVRPVIDIYGAFLTQYPAKFSDNDLPDDLEAIQSDMDGMGATREKFFRETVIPMTLLLTTSFIIVDKPTPAVDPPSRYHEIISGQMPYARLILPTDLVNWKRDAFGRFEWAVIRKRNIAYETPLDPIEQAEDTYVYYSPSEWYEMDAEGTVLGDKTTNPLGEVPIITCRPYRSNVYGLYGTSFGPDVADLALKIYNVKSLEDEFYYKQCFPFLAFPGQVEQSKIGANNVITFDPEGPPPLYVAPPVETTRALQEEIDQNIREIYRLACLPYESDSREAESGYSKEFDWQTLTRRLKGLADTFSHIEYEIYRLAGKWTGREAAWSIPVEWSKEFQVRDLSRMIEAGLASKPLRLGARAEKEYKKKIARTLLPDADQETLAEVDEEIEAQPDFDSMIPTLRSFDSEGDDDDNGPDNQAP